MFIISCGGHENAPIEKEIPNEVQSHLQEEGWSQEQPKNGDMPESYGVHTKYGLQDNYFDIQVGKGLNLAIKLIDAQTGECVRYAFVNENTLTTINQIPQGTYYLMVASGFDWMVKEEDGKFVGKFTRRSYYERSLYSYDFGKKNSSEANSYKLEINLVNDELQNNFATEEITEKDFLEK
jgi:hypothetical protein